MTMLPQRIVIICDNNPRNIIELDPDSDDQDFYILGPEPIKREPPPMFTPSQIKTTVRPNTFTPEAAGIYSNAELDQFWNRILFSKHSDSTLQLLGKALSYSFISSNTPNYDANSPQDSGNTYKTLRIGLHDKLLNLTPLFTPTWFSDAFIGFFGYPCYTLTQYSNAELDQFWNGILFSIHSDSTLQLGKDLSYSFISSDTPDYDANSPHDNSYNTLRIGLHDKLINLTPLFTPTWFSDAFIALFGYPCYILTQCGRCFSTFLLVQATRTLIVKLYKTISIKYNIENNITLFSSIAHGFSIFLQHKWSMTLMIIKTKNQ